MDIGEITNTYLIRRQPGGLDSTAFMEIGPGRYSGKHWQKGFLFVSEDAFGMAEGILRKHFPAYDHFGMNEIPKESGLGVLADWQRAADALSGLTIAEAATFLNLKVSRLEGLENGIGEHQDLISAMLRGLASECQTFYQNEDWICVLGM